MARKYRFVWLDVFAERPLEGNQLAVFPDARGLTDGEMQSIARETHLSETTFVFPGDPASDRERGFTTRIFAVAGEMPFAGHPTLGTASVLCGLHGLTEVALALKVGRIPVRFSLRDGKPFGEMVQNDPVVGQQHDAKVVAKALNISKGDLDPKRPIQTVSTGVPFAIVPFRSLDVLSRIRPDLSAMDDYLKGTDAKFFYLVAKETVDPSASLHARMLFSGGEDPATGSAAGPAVAWMVLHGWAKPDEPVLIEQGLEVERTSHIHGQVGLREGRPVNVRIGGRCVPVIQGELDL
ncbi:MAG TPA: PhzF family phenazine biosynthesis protein [Thermoplasmata archaeon]|nr:PhzF family phenazine biosynthesis protein [Thermoplasmata archaeon]